MPLKNEQQFMYYPEITSTRFNEEIYLKREFRSNEIKEMDLEQNSKNNKKIKDFELDPHQIFLKNYISPDTPYNGILIFHGTGVGKTCSAISIAEGFKKTLKNINKRLSEVFKISFTKNLVDISTPLFIAFFFKQLITSKDESDTGNTLLSASIFKFNPLFSNQSNTSPAAKRLNDSKSLIPPRG